MSKQTVKPLDNRNWYKDRYQAVLLQRRMLTGISLLSLSIALVMAIIGMRITPLKSVEPFVIQVDAKSGITQTVDPLTVKEITGTEAVNNFFLVGYIRAREGYNVHDVSRNYTTVRVMSDPSNVYPSFTRDANPNNPQSNAARMGSGGVRSVKFKSISYLKPDFVQARLLIEETSVNGAVTQLHKIVSINFEYTKLGLTNEERYINPLGFRVTEYRIDEDALPR